MAPVSVEALKKKRKLEPLEDFDPRPVEFRGIACANLPALLEKIHGEQLCISLLFDKHFCYWDQSGSSMTCLLYTSPSPRDRQKSRMPSSA